MENFVYQAGTEVWFGKDQIQNLKDIISRYGKRVLLCYGGGSIKRMGLYDTIMRLLDEYEVHELSGIAPNPKVESVKEGIALCHKHNIDVVLAVGGGSVIDCAKVIAAGTYYDGDPWKLVKEGIQVEKALPVVTVVTLAATGSEYDGGAVISNPETNEKIGYDSPLIKPAASILDPQYTCTVPVKQTVAGSIDIMSHLLEQYFAPANTYLTDALCIAGLKTVVKYAPIAVENPNDIEARGELLWLSSLACNGILSTGSQYGGWPCHAIEHELSAFYDVTHGTGLAIITPSWMRFALSESTAARFAQYGREIWGIEENLPVMEIAKQAIAKTEDFFVKLGSPVKLHEINIGEEHFAKMAEQAVENGMLSYAYVPMNKEDVIHVLKESL